MSSSSQTKTTLNTVGDYEIENSVTLGIGLDKSDGDAR